MEEATRTQKVKDHFKKHKVAYIGVGVGLTAGVVIGAAASNTSVVNVNVQKLFNWKTSDVTTNVTNVQVQMVRPGPKSFAVQCVESQQTWPSIRQAAKDLGVHPWVISGHLKGKSPNIDGLTFIKLAEL